MNDPKQIISYCVGKMQTNWTVTPIQFADAVELDATKLQEFVKFSVVFSDFRQLSFNEPVDVSILGIVIASIYTRSGHGPGRKYDLFNIYRPIFDRVLDNNNGIFFKPTMANDLGDSINGLSTVNPNWTVLQCSTEFWSR